MERFYFFPVPQPMETVYSVFCRCWTRSGLPRTLLLRALTGQPRCKTLLADLPGHLAQIASAIPLGHPWTEARTLLTDHTLFPYYTYFSLPDAYLRALNRCLAETVGHCSELTLGQTLHRCHSSSRHPRFCPKCASEDAARVGYSYFRVEHQLPGVVVCWRHGNLLADGCTECGRYPLRGRSLGMAGSCHCSHLLTSTPRYIDAPKSTDSLLWIARESAYMVSAPLLAHRDPLALRRCLISRGFGRGSLIVPEDLADAVNRQFGTEVLDFLGYPAKRGSR